MKLLRSIVRGLLFVVLNLAIAAAFAAPPDSATLQEAAPRVQSAADDAVRVILRGNIHPLIRGQAGAASSQTATDLGAAEDSLPAGRLLLLLQRSPQQESALTDFIQAAHTRGSSSFHQWLTPGGVWPPLRTS
ncbi:MAG: hypothetical protein ABSD72_08560 [Terracidiphilus sp.]